MYGFAKFFAHFFTPFFTYLSIVTRLFKIDPSKGQTPRDPLMEEKATPQELLKLAKQKIKDRKPLIKGPLDRC